MWVGVSVKEEALTCRYTCKTSNQGMRAIPGQGDFQQVSQIHWNKIRRNTWLLFVILEELPCTLKLSWCDFDSYLKKKNILSQQSFLNKHTHTKWNSSLIKSQRWWTIISESQDPLFPLKCSFRNEFAPPNCDFISHAVPFFHNHRIAGEDSVQRERSQEQPTDAEWFTGIGLSLSLLDREAVSILATQGLPCDLGRTPSGMPVKSQALGSVLPSALQ